MGPSTSDAAARAGLIEARLPLAAVADAGGIKLHLAGPHSRLGELLGPGGRSPYWAYCWAGGMALVRHILAHPELVEGRHILDYGAGSGLVGIVAAKAGAASVLCLETDAMARAAIARNAAANGATLEIAPTPEMPPASIDLVLAGDVFYLPAVARRNLGWLGACTAAGMTVLVGDPGRRDLPRDRLEAIAHYRVRDFGSAEAGIDASVSRLLAAPVHVKQKAGHAARP